MNSLSEQEYWDLCQRLANQQYSDEEDCYEMDLSNIPESVWMPSEPAAKEKMLRAIKSADYNGVIDLTNAKSTQILEKIHKCRNFQVETFLIKVTKFKGDPSGIKLDIVIYEEDKKKRKPNKQSNQFNVVNKLDVSRDDRFKTRDWKTYFNNTKTGKDIPLEKITEIFRWLQAIQKLKAYL